MKLELPEDEVLDYAINEEAANEVFECFAFEPNARMREFQMHQSMEDWRYGKTLPPAGVLIAEECKIRKIPIVFCTDTYHHGIKTEPVNRYATGIKIIDAMNVKNGNAPTKRWGEAVEYLLGQIK